MAKLVVLSEGLAGKTHELTVDTTTVGRVEDNAFQIPESSVSSHHAEIIRRGSDVVIKDLNSTNGTFINGQQITGEGVLKPGQILRLGQIELRLEDGAAASAAPSKAASAPAAADPRAQAGKKLPDHTMVIPQGVKLGQEPQTKSVAFDKGAFAKKSNTGTKVFIIVAAGLGLILIAVILFFAFGKT
ncbi:MAG: FHA domain-containing protein [Limisphaerales bacterium]